MMSLNSSYSPLSLLSFIMANYKVTVYKGDNKSEEKIQARNQNNLKERVQGLGYDRAGHISKVD